MTFRWRASMVVIALAAAVSISVGAGSASSFGSDRSLVTASDDSMASRSDASIGRLHGGPRTVLAAAREVRSTKASQVAVLVLAALVALTAAAVSTRWRSHDVLRSPPVLLVSALSRRGPPSFA